MVFVAAEVGSARISFLQSQRIRRSGDTGGTNTRTTSKNLRSNQCGTVLEAQNRLPAL